MLSHEEARSYYDRFGSKQDSQSFYEDPATNLLIDHAGFEEAHSIFEFGVGTGRFAQRVLAAHTPPDCRYRGIDISPTMVGIAKGRLQEYGQRVSIELSRGEPSLSEDDNRYDRFVTNYVLDLMSQDDGSALIDEAYRVLQAGGLLCLVSLANGRTLPTRIVSAIWTGIYKVNARIVGGCRPIDLSPMVSGPRWHVEYRTTLASFGLTSEILVGRKL